MDSNLLTYRELYKFNSLDLNFTPLKKVENLDDLKEGDHLFFKNSTIENLSLTDIKIKNNEIIYSPFAYFKIKTNPNGNSFETKKKTIENAYFQISLENNKYNIQVLFT